MPISRSVRLFVAGAAILVLGLAGCASTDSHAKSSPAGAAVVNGGSLTYGINEEPDCLDPHISGLTVVQEIDRNLVDSLVAENPAGKIVPWLAKSWSVAKNLRSYSFTLRSGVTFSDGTPVTAAAIKANFDDIANPATKSHYAVSLLGPYAGTTVINGTTVRVNFTRPYAPFLQNATTPLLGLLSTKDLAKSASARCNGVVGSGPFTLTSWTPNQSVVVARRVTYAWAPAFSANQGAAHLSQVTFRLLTQDAVRTGALSSGQAQLVDAVPPVSAKSITSNSRLRLLTHPVPGATYSLFLKTVGGPLANEKVRLALQHSVNLGAIVSAASDGQFTRAWSQIGPTTTAYDRSLEKSSTYSTTKANAELTAAGWTGRDSAGYRTKDGKRLSLTWLLSPGQTPLQSTITQLVQSAAQKVGIQIVIASEPVGTFLQRLYSTGDYDLFASSYGGLGPDELNLAFNSASRPANGVPNGNISLLDHKSVDGWLGAGAATLNVTARATDYANVQKYVVSHVDVIPIYVPTTIDAASAKVHGLTWDIEAFPLLQAAWLSK
jgi:peptide/nickel transport system substrate-binding protein